MASWRFVKVTCVDRDGDEFRFDMNSIRQGAGLWWQAAEEAERRRKEAGFRPVLTMTILEPHAENRDA